MGQGSEEKFLTPNKIDKSINNIKHTMVQRQCETWDGIELVAVRPMI